MPGDRNSIACSYVHTGLALRLPGVTISYYLTVAGVSQPSSSVAREIRNAQEPQNC